jgi:hypothetical protein
VARKAFTLLACCFALAGAPLAHARPFGVLYSWREAPDFSAHGLATNPDIAQWLMTLPQPGNWREPGADQAMRSELFDDKPLAGEVHHFSPARSSSEQVADASVARQLFDAEPMGSAPYRFTNPLAQSTAVAANTERGGASIEGRSASDVANSATPRVASETCTCLHK